MNGRILVVDDEPLVAKVVASMLDIDGHDVSVANNGEDALRLCSAADYEVVVTDYHMPGMNGSELIGKIRALDGPEPVIILLTGSAVADDAPEELIVFDILAKPVKADILRATVKRAVERYRRYA